MSEVPLYLSAELLKSLAGEVKDADDRALPAHGGHHLPFIVQPDTSSSFFERPTSADTDSGSAERPCLPCLTSNGKPLVGLQIYSLESGELQSGERRLSLEVLESLAGEVEEADDCALPAEVGHHLPFIVQPDTSSSFFERPT